MNSQRITYYTPTEYQVMLEFSGTGNYTILRAEQAADAHEIADALVSLYRRNLLIRAGETFTVSERGRCFAEMRRAPYAVSMRGGLTGTRLAIAYVNERVIWFSELTDDIVSWRYRIHALRPQEVYGYLLDEAWLSPPTLRETDTLEIGAPLDADSRCSEEASVRLDRYVNGSALLCSCALYSRRGFQLLCRSDTESHATEYFTRESATRLINELFGA